MKKLLSFLTCLSIVQFLHGQCPTSGTISSNCTSSNWTPSGNVTVNGGVVVTVTGTMELNGGRTVTGTGATFNIGAFSETWGDGNSLVGGTYNVSGNFTSGNGSSFSMTNITADVSGNFTLGQTSIQTVTNCMFEVQGTAFIGGGTHNVSNSTFKFAMSYPSSTLSETLGFNGGAILNLTNGSLLTLNGSVNAGNSARINIDNSEMSVSGNFDNAGQGHMTVTNDGSFAVGGNYDNSGTGHTFINGGGLLQVSGNFNNSGGGSELVIDGGATVVGGSFSGNAPNVSSSPGQLDACSGGGGGCCGVGCEPLPVSLIELRAERHDGYTRLHWQTASETNNDFFTIEKSADGRLFTEVAKIPGSGTTHVITTYEWVDHSPVGSSLSFYRLKQTDYDGTSETLGIVSISADHEQLAIMPNPVAQNGILYVQGAVWEKASWAIYTLDGKKQLQGLFDEAFAVPVGNIARGQYLLAIENSRQRLFGRFIVD